MITLPGVDLGGAEELLQQHDAGQLVRKGHGTHAQLEISPGSDGGMQSQRPSDNKDDITFSLREQFLQLRCYGFAGSCLPSMHRVMT